MKKLLILSLITIALPLSAVIIKNETDKDFLLKGEKSQFLKSQEEDNHFPLKRTKKGVFSAATYSFAAENNNKTYSFPLEHAEDEITSITLKMEGERLIAHISAGRDAKFDDYDQAAQ